MQQVIKEEGHLSRRLVSRLTLMPVLSCGEVVCPYRVWAQGAFGETDRDIICTYQVLEEKPTDTALLKLGVDGHKRLFRKKLKAVAATVVSTRRQIRNGPKIAVSGGPVSKKEEN